LPLAYLEVQSIEYTDLSETAFVRFWEPRVTLSRLGSRCSSQIVWGKYTEEETKLRLWQAVGWAAAIAYLLEWVIFIGIRAAEIARLARYVRLTNALIVGMLFGCPCGILVCALAGPTISCLFYRHVGVQSATLAKSTVAIATVGLGLGLVATLFPRLDRRASTL